MSGTVLELRDVSFRYPQCSDAILSSLHLSVPAGEFVGVVGPTGCGKTTLLKLLSGVVPHYEHGEISGTVTILGSPSASWSLPRLSERIGFVLEDPEDQVFNLRVRDEVTWGLENRGMAAAEIFRRADEALDFFGIRHLADRVTFDLSGGEKQRLALASIYAIRPEIMLLDKPTSELDPGGTEQVLDAIRALKGQGQTVIVVEDKMDFLLSCCDRLLLLDQGQIRIDGPPESFAVALSKQPGISVRNSDAVLAALELGHPPLHFFERLSR